MNEEVGMYSAAGEAKREILNRQMDWAKGKNCIKEGYFDEPEKNIPWLSGPMRKELEQGDGAEFGKEGKRGKICALHSSSALAVNFFGYWCGRDWSALAQVLGIQKPMGLPHFEEKFPTRIGPRAPNLDVTLEGANGVFAVESKFTEWLGKPGRKPLREAYLKTGSKPWSQVGLEGAQSTAETYLDSPGFIRLDVPQLLKHLLGLATQRPKGDWQLLLVWYGPPSRTAREMKLEISRFSKMLESDNKRFRAMTYQDLWTDLRPQLGSEHREYREYLDSRYF